MSKEPHLSILRLVDLLLSLADAFDIIPRFFKLPRDYDEFKKDVERNPNRLYIQKPTNSSRGRGVKMILRPKDVPRDTKDVLIQHYVDRPLLINRLKFDLRIYICATCMDPLRLYVYTDGLARFATEEYSEDKSDLKNRCVHLTNVSVNKKSSKFVANESTEEESSGSKWSLRALRSYFDAQDSAQGKTGSSSWSLIWKQVHDISVKSVLAAECRMNVENKVKVPHRYNCFEVFGIDVMLDSDLRAWLIEVNTCPSLASDCPLDSRVKGSMISDCMNMVGVVPFDLEALKAEVEARKQARLTGLPTGREAPQQHQVAMPKTVKEAEEMDFTSISQDRLPDIIIEMEAEYERRRGWERAFPCVEDPLKYLDLFETPRTSNTMACLYLASKKGSKKPGTSGTGRHHWRVQ